MCDNFGKIAVEKAFYENYNLNELRNMATSSIDYCKGPEREHLI